MIVRMATVAITIGLFVGVVGEVYGQPTGYLSLLLALAWGWLTAPWIWGDA